MKLTGYNGIEETLKEHKLLETKKKEKFNHRQKEYLLSWLLNSLEVLVGKTNEDRKIS